MISDCFLSYLITREKIVSGIKLWEAPSEYLASNELMSGKAFNRTQNIISLTPVLFIYLVYAFSDQFRRFLSALRPEILICEAPSILGHISATAVGIATTVGISYAMPVLATRVGVLFFQNNTVNSVYCNDLYLYLNGANTGIAKALLAFSSFWIPYSWSYLIDSTEFGMLISGIIEFGFDLTVSRIIIEMVGWPLLIAVSSFLIAVAVYLRFFWKFTNAALRIGSVDSCVGKTQKYIFMSAIVFIATIAYVFMVFIPFVAKSVINIYPCSSGDLIDALFLVLGNLSWFASIY
jgi:hypothetical protein